MDFQRMGERIIKTNLYHLALIYITIKKLFELII